MKSDLLDLINGHIEFSKSNIECNFTRNFIQREGHKSDKLYEGDMCEVHYQFEVARGEDLIYYKAEKYKSWYQWDSRERMAFEEKIKKELILKGLFQL